MAQRGEVEDVAGDGGARLRRVGADVERLLRRLHRRVHGGAVDDVGVEQERRHHGAVVAERERRRVVQERMQLVRIRGAV